MPRRPRRKKGKEIPYVYVFIVLLIAGVGYLVIFNPFASKPKDFPFPCVTQSLALHVHPWLRITINGQNITIPTAIGIQDPQYQGGIATGGSCFEPLHTHDSSGIIHIEASDAIAQYTLGDFFRVWNATYGSIGINGASHPIVFNSTDIFGFKSDQTHQILLLVDGNSSSAFASLNLNQLDYCSSANANVAPCSPTAGGDPYYNGQPYPYGTGHTIVIEYTAKSG